MPRLKLRTKLIALALPVLLFLSLVVRPTNATTTAYVNPSSGTVNGTFSVYIMVNTEGADLDGVDVDLTYSGPINYVSVASGDAGCTPSVSRAGYKISVTCLPAPGSPINGTKTVARLTFATTGTGSVSMTLADAGGNLDSVTGASFTSGSSSSLPDAAIGMSNSGLILAVGAFFIVAGTGLLVDFPGLYAKYFTRKGKAERGLLKAASRK